MNDKPLIWTIYGNMPVESLQYRTEWENADTYIKLTETYLFNDEVVRQSAHVFDKLGVLAAGEAARI